MKFGTLQVYPRQGLLQEHGLELPTAVIGRGEGSNIHVDDFSVSRRHARLTIDSGRLLVEDLGSVGGTFVDGERLEPGVRHLVEESATIRFGEIEARYVAPPSAESSQSEAFLAHDEFVSAGGLSVAIASPDLPIDPGKVSAATLVIVNRGRLVDNVRVEITDLPDTWYTIDTPTFPILPGGRADVKVSLHPPRRHESLAGDYKFTVVVRSQEYDEHPEAEGRFQVLPFEAAEISLEAIRSKRHFRLLAENHGNDVARYQLAGRDDEQVFRYLFESPAIELQPGEKRIVALDVRRSRQLFGPAQFAPFQVLGTSDSGAEITARGQLSVKPPLQRFRMPVMFTLAALVLAVTAVAVLILVDDGGAKTASAEDPFAGVHLCSDSNAKDDQAKKNADAANDKPLTSATVVGPYDGGRPIFGQVDRNGAPFFAQNDARWAAQEYARSTELPNGKDWCGTTIEQCGCAMTSVSVMLALYDILQMPDGQPLSPKALNDWFNGAARKTERGWVSRGYIYGDVIWTAANELSGEIAKTNPNSRTVRFVRTGNGSEEDIRGELTAGRPVILEVPGHWIAAVGLDQDGTILINDPFYRDRKTLDAYKGKVRSSVHYEPSSDLSSVVITAPADVKFRITDKQGRVVNTGDGTVDQPADAINQIPGASVAKRTAWRDPTCIEKAPPAGAGTNQVVLPGSRDDYVVEIIGTGSQPGAVAIHTYGKDGASSIATIEGAEGTKAEIDYDPNASKPVINVINNGTPQSTTTPNADGGGGGDDETPVPAPSATAVPPPTATPFVEQRTAMTLPAEAGQSRVEVATNTGFELGDPIRFAPGLPNEEDNIIVGFGSFILATPLRFAHSPGEPIARLQRPPGQGPGLPPGVTPPPATGPLEPPKEVTMACSTIYQGSPKLATLICDLQVNGGYTSTRWTLNGKVVNEFTGSSSMVMTFPADTPANISATVCNVTLCRSTSRNEAVQFPANPGANAASNPGGSSGSGAPQPTPPAGSVVVTCGTSFDQNKVPAIAVVDCQANFSGEFTAVAWSAPGGQPSSASGQKKTFTTQLVNDLGAPTTIKITATVCNFGNCRTSTPVTVGIGKTKTIVTTEPLNEVNQRHSVTLFAAVLGLNGIVPSGGNVQFFADDVPILPSAALFTVGSTSVAQVTIQTGGRAGLTTVGAHTIYAVYSGGVNAFGSTSETIDYTVLDPIPDDCDSVDEDANLDTDETCNFSVPKNLGGGTVLQSLSITGPGVVQTDGAPNAVVASPGGTLFVSGTVGRTEYCPGCLRQVYFGIGGYDTQTIPTKVGPVCVYTGGTVPIPSVLPTGTWGVAAPTTPGVYYIRATTTLDYFCVGPALGPPDLSVGRIVVRSAVVATVDAFINDDAGAAPLNPWDDTLSTPITKAAAGQRLIVRGRVPVGAVGVLDISGFLNAAGAPQPLVAQICPPDGKVPEGTFKGNACTPGEARVLSPVLTDNASQIPIRATYRNATPLRLMDPAFGFTSPVVNDYPVFIEPTSGPPSIPDPYDVGVLVSANVALAAVPNPVQMGQSFTLTATMAPVVPPPTGTVLTAEGGTVQFWAGPDNNPANSNKIGSPVTVAADGTASITWSPRNCGDPPPAVPNPCAAPSSGFPFDAQDQVGVSDAYKDVHAEYITGGNSNLKSGTSANIDVDIDPAPSTANITAIGVGSGTCAAATAIHVDDVLCVSAILTGHNGFSPEGETIRLRVGTNELATAIVGTPTPESCVLSGTDYNCTATLHYSTGVSGQPLDTSGTYNLYVRFDGTSEIAADDSPDFPVTLVKNAATLTVSTPTSVTVGTNATLQAVISPTCSGSSTSCAAGGTVSFYIGSSTSGTLIGTSAALSGSGTTATLSASTSSGALAGASTYTGITARYNGNRSVAAVDSGNSVDLTVYKYTPTVTLNAITSVQVGSNLVLTGSVSGSGIQTPVGGNVSFYLGGTAGTLLGTDSDLSNGVSLSVPTGDGQTLATACPPPPPDPNPCYLNIVASYSGNSNVEAAVSSGRDAELTKRSSTVTTTAGSTAVTGSDITLNATVAAATAPTTAVSVACTACLQFQVDVPVAGWQPVGGKVDVAANGAATTTQATGSGAPYFPNAQTYSIRAVYDGTGNYTTATSAAVNATVTKHTPTVAIVATDVVAGASTSVTVTVTATVSPNCTGCIAIKAGSTTITGLGALNYPTGAITVPTGASGQSGTCLDNVGTCTLTAEYSGNGGVSSGSANDSFTISSATSSVVVTFTPASGSVEVDSSIDLIATVSVSGGGQTPTCTGCLQFRLGSTTGTPIGSAQDVPASGIVTLARTTGGSTPFQVGSYTIYAVYTGKTYVQGSNGNAAMTVTAHATAIAATATQTGPAGSATTLSASITWSGNQNAIDSGTVQFLVNGVNQGAAVTVTNGVATLSVTLAPGTYQITAVYSGGGDFAGSSDLTNFQIVIT